VLIFPVRIYASVFLGLWFLLQLVEANFGLFSARAGGGGTAFFAHVGGFLFGVLVARLLAGSGVISPRAGEPAPAGGLL
jgi:membrane associated rhomboid family serine protease